MKLLNLKDNHILVSLSKNELFILRAILSEIYADVCVDSEEFEIIHGIDKNEVLKLNAEIQDLYDKLL